MPTATLPIYTGRRPNGRVDRRALLDRAIEQFEGGVGMITIHPRATRNSRDGESNAYLDILPEPISVVRRFIATISIAGNRVFGSWRLRRFGQLNARVWSDGPFPVARAAATPARYSPSPDPR